MDRIKSIIRANKIALFIGLLAIITAIILLVVIKGKDKDIEPPIEYDYTQEEQYLADSEIAFLDTYLSLTDENKRAAANEAVKIYRVIINSDTDIINAEHSNTIKTRLRQAIIKYCDYAEELTDEELNALSSGMCELIYEMILKGVDSIDEGSVNANDLELLRLSLEGQIEDLKSQKANIKIHIRADLDADTLISGFESLSDEELKEIATMLGYSDIESLKSAYSGNTLDEAQLNKLKDEVKKAIDKDLDKKISDKTKNLNGKDGRNGKDGKDGINGRNGKDGSDGKDGKSAYEMAKEKGFIGSESQYLESLEGTDGKTTFIAYATGPNGEGFSLSPTNTTKYIGTCMSYDTTQSADPKAYSWSEYKDYIITYNAEENTVVITN